MPIATRAFAAVAADKPLEPWRLDRRDPGPDDVAIEIKYCGVCHSDLHVARNELGGGTRYPIVPGHEIAGLVTAVGGNVSRFKVGDRVGVGCMVDSCRQCQPCLDGEEQYCVPGMTQTYGSADPKGEAVGQTVTQGGYSDAIVVDQNYVVTIPDSIPLDAAAPLLCAGITTYSPLRHWKVGPGSKVAVIGLGGLGHMAVKQAAAIAVLSELMRKCLAPIRSASAFLRSEVDRTVTSAPIAAACLTAIWPRPPRPITATFDPGPTFQCLSGE